MRLSLAIRGNTAQCQETGDALYDAPRPATRSDSSSTSGYVDCFRALHPRLPG
jgi:hypothetical protein